MSRQIPLTAADRNPGPDELHRRWIMEGWEHREEDGPFVFDEKLGGFYSSGTDLHLYDSFDPQHRVSRSAQEYRHCFEPVFNSFRSVRHTVTDAPDLLQGEDLAATTLEFVARLETKDGKVFACRARSSMVWRRESGTWKIAREQNAVREASLPEVEALIGPSDAFAHARPAHASSAPDGDAEENTGRNPKTAA